LNSIFKNRLKFSLCRILSESVVETNTVRTQVVLNKEIVEQALQITHFKSKRELLDYALRELIRRETQKKLLELKGKIHWEGDLEALRENQAL
jgi:Arc/MetJ family transcription regulator